MSECGGDSGGVWCVVMVMVVCGVELGGEEN